MLVGKPATPVAWEICSVELPPIEGVPRASMPKAANTFASSTCGARMTKRLKISPAAAEDMFNSSIMAITFELAGFRNWKQLATAAAGPDEMIIENRFQLSSYRF